MRISDWSSDVCSSDLLEPSRQGRQPVCGCAGRVQFNLPDPVLQRLRLVLPRLFAAAARAGGQRYQCQLLDHRRGGADLSRHSLSGWIRSEEHTSELQSLMRISYAVFCLKKKKINKQ